jgi:hypothetical protein
MHTNEGYRRKKITEEALAKSLKEYKITIPREFQCDFKCRGSERQVRKDRFVLIINGVVILPENDEYAHRNRNCLRRQKNGRDRRGHGREENTLLSS